MLATAKVIVKASNGSSTEFRAVIDSGSQVNIVTERLIQRLSLSTTEASLCIDGIGRTQKRAHRRVNLQLMSRSHDCLTNLEAFILPTIIPAQPSRIIDVSTWDIPKDIHLADPNFHLPEKIDILLGAELYFSLVRPGIIKLNNSGPVLQNTSLGWIIGGLVKQHTEPGPSSSLACAILNKEFSLEEAIEQLWKLDEIDSTERTMSPAENLCEAHFNQYVQSDPSGRFIVRIPFKENPTALGQSHQTTYNRFISLEKRLQKNEKMRDEYIKFMREYERLGHMEKVNISEIPNPRYFIPHHCVLSPDSTSTKLRVVFDASSKTSTGYSLNDIMHTGPTVQSELFSILLRFRLPKFVFTTDIEKMYRQILINTDDHQYQLIIWREDPASPINYYKLNTVTYGTRSAPYLATRCLNQIAKENNERYPLGAKMLRENFYVDDGLGGSDSLHLAKETQQELKLILAARGFHLKKWCSNHPKLLEGIPHDDRIINLDLSEGTHKPIKTLGLHWVPQTDNFCIKVNLTERTIASKRTVTSELAKLFDPLGLLAPVVVQAKIFIQHLWQNTLDWDEPLPQELCMKWNDFRSDLKTLEDFKIKRHMFYNEIPVTTQLHVFADASEKAFGAAAYIRATLKNGRVCVRLLCAKSRVAPLKQQTLPRLELCAAVVAAQLAHKVNVDLNRTNQPTFLWTDSEIVLSWINSQSSSYKTFVANRVSTIQSLTLAGQWRHVRSNDNPADILSRGLQPSKLLTNALWFHGPMFLHGSESLWPSCFSPQPLKADHPELKKVVMAATSTQNYDLIYTINHKNSFGTLQRITAYVLRFTRNLRIPARDRPTHISLTPKELDDSLHLIVRAIQCSDFAEDIRQLQRNQTIDKKSPLNSLSPILDKEGVVRVGGRLKNSELSQDTMHPIILPYNDSLARLLFIMLHENNKHCGPQSLLTIMRQRFWPIKGKITARSVVQKCVRCTRARPQLHQQIMGNLPQPRVVPSRPFINSGVDYCGPFWIHYKIRGKKPTKAYVAVFCCFSTKAVHLELVSDLSTESFIGALKRFIARRGHCQNIFCDNATNFVGAKNLLELSESIHSEKAQEAIITASSAKGIHFSFIPPRAPHFGGLWEAAVKSAKHLLVRSVSTESLTYEELETIIIEIEAILNSRPLIPLSNDPTCLEALTPGHFLIGEALTSQVDSRAKNLKVSGISHWNLVSQVKQQFWKRWSTEYLSELQHRYKWKCKSSNFKTGDMVIIKDDNLPIMKWPLGRILNVYPGDDGTVRVVEVKTLNGVFKRPVHRLAPLCSEDEKEPLEQKRSRDDERNQIPQKRIKTLDKPILLTLVISLLLIPVVLCNNIAVTQFQEDPGLYFEGMGTVKLITAEWKLMVYYDLTPFISEIKSLASGLQTLQQLCPTIKRHSMCSILSNNLNLIKNELLQEEELIIKRRVKRAPFNIVGNIARSLFGVLDSEYANEISQTINKAKLEHGHLASLLRNQTSIIDSTINIIKLDEINTQQRLTEITQMIEQNQNELFKESAEISNSQLVGLLSTHLTLTAITLQKIETEIIAVLTDVHNGKISPMLLSPQQLKNEITTIKAHLPMSHMLPTEDENLIALYQLMNAKGAVTKNEVIFEVKIPLVDQQFLELFNIVPIPTVKNKFLIAINPDKAYLATNSHRDEYVLFTPDDMSSCIKAKDDEYLCPNQQSKLRRNNNNDPCEISMFNNQSTTNCNIHKIPTPMFYSQLKHKNKWIFATTSEIETSTVCGTETTLIGTGLMEIGPNCVLKNSLMTIQGHFVMSTSTHTSLIRQKHLKSISKPPEPDGLPTHATRLQQRTQLEQLTALQQQLNESTLTHLPQLITSDSQHHYAVSYTALILCTLVILTLLVWKVRSRQPKPIPTPAVRSQLSTINIPEPDSSPNHFSNCVQRGGEC